MQVTARADLADLQPNGNVESMLDRIWFRFPEATASVLAYSNDPKLGWELVERCEQHLPAGRVAVGVLVNGDTWYERGGASGAVDPYGPLAAQAAVQGLQRRDRRADLEAGFTPSPMTNMLKIAVVEAFATTPAVHDIDAAVTQMHDLVSRHVVDGGAHLDTPDAIRMAVLAGGVPAQQMALVMINPHDAPHHLNLWQSVVRHVPPLVAEAPTYLAGLAAWAAGDGARATVALESAERLGRGDHNELGRLLNAITDQVIPPTQWNSMQKLLLEQAHPSIQTALNRHAAGIPGAQWETVGPPNPNHTRGAESPGGHRPHRSGPSI